MNEVHAMGWPEAVWGLGAFLMMFGFYAFVVWINARQERSSKRVEEELRIADVLERIELKLKKPSSIPLNFPGNYTVTETTFVSEWTAKCPHCRSKNRLRSKDTSDVRCGKCGLPFMMSRKPTSVS